MRDQTSPDSGALINQNPSSSDWAAARGEKWRTQLCGTEPMLRPVNEPLIRALELTAPCRIADIGCGAGETAIEIRRVAPVGSVVHGFDIAPGLIEVARARVRPDERALAFEVADVATTKPAQPYDRLVSRFGVMFFDDPQAAFANLLRWLEPGGRFAFAVWGRPAENSWFKSLRELVARIIELPPPDLEAPGPFRYGDAAKFCALLERAGFARLDVQDWRGALPIGGNLTPADAAHFALAAFSAFGELLAKAGDAALNEARRALTELFSNHHQDGAVRMDACVHLVTGIRP